MAHHLGTDINRLRGPSRARNDSPTVARIRILAALVLVSAIPSMAYAQPATTQAGDVFAPGQHVWRDAGGAGPVAIVISIPQQLAHVYRNGELVGVSTVSTGTRRKPTPTGAFTILEKKRFHRSNLYSNAPMPFMQRLTWSGIALHAGDLPGYPASHGCIRFPAAFARQLFAATELGGEVRVIDEALPRTTLAPAGRDMPPLIVADAGRIARHDDAARAGDESAAPRIELADDATRFAAYDVAVASGYGAKGGTD